MSVGEPVVGDGDDGSRATQVSPTPRVVPSDDLAFRGHVERLCRDEAFPTPESLAARLRRLFPRVVVRASEVSGHDHVWYVYRDGVWRASDDDRWWQAPGVPRLALTMDGWVREANPAARSLLGLTAMDQLPRHFTDFIVPGTLEDATSLFRVVADGHALDATALVQPIGGEVIACDIRARPAGDPITVWFRVAPDIQVPAVSRAATDVGETPKLTCLPATDTLFARYVAEAVERMSEPTPEGLALRLRRLYPHTSVLASGDGWTVHRDGGGGRDDEIRSGSDPAWWQADGLPAVRYDGQGRILEANAAAETLLGRDVVDRHWQELVVAGTADEVEAVLRLISDVGWAESRFRMPAPDGALFEFDSYTEVAGDSFLTIMRPRPPGAAR